MVALRLTYHHAAYVRAVRVCKTLTENRLVLCVCGAGSLIFIIIRYTR
jgi:hypothetical protein